MGSVRGCSRGFVRVARNPTEAPERRGQISDMPTNRQVGSVNAYAVSEGLAAVNAISARDSDLAEPRTLRGPAVKMNPSKPRRQYPVRSPPVIVERRTHFQPLDRVVSCPPTLLARGLEAAV